MRSSTIVLAVGLLAAPLALLASPDSTAVAAGFPQLIAQNDVSNTVNGRPLVDAPVPSIPPAGLPPVDRVAGEGGRALAAGPTNSTPFSNTPSGMLSDGGTQVANADRVYAPANDSGVTPNLSK